MVDVVTLLVPRHERWAEYIPLLDLQRRTAEKFGHRHIVVTERAAAVELIAAGFTVMTATLGENLMHAIVDGQIAWLEEWTGDYPCVLVDIDCLIGRDLNGAFDGTFEIGLTNRPNPVDPKSPVNNGAMYIAAGAKDSALKFFRRARVFCREHWGGDQEAIAHAARPVPNHYGVEIREGIKIGFISMHTHNCVPSVEGRIHKHRPYVIHFKGDRKSWMRTYAKHFIL